jgi:hypothetical protein
MFSADGPIIYVANKKQNPIARKNKINYKTIKREKRSLLVSTKPAVMVKRALPA